MRRLLAVALLAGAADSAPAQVIDARPRKFSDQWIFEGSGFAGFPTGDFRKDEKIGGGLNLSVALQPFRRQPLALRMDLGGMIYDGLENDEDQEVCDFFGNNCQNETVFYDNRHHYMSFVQAGPEFFATDGKVRPYAFALGGVTFFNSTAAYGPTGTGQSNTRSLFTSQNVSSTYGVGLRFVTKNYGREGGFDIGVRFMRNAKARYLTDKGVYRRADGSYDVSARQGAANVLMIHIGYNGGPFVNWDERRPRP